MERACSSTIAALELEIVDHVEEQQRHLGVVGRVAVEIFAGRHVCSQSTTLAGAPELGSGPGRAPRSHDPRPHGLCRW